MQWNAETTLLTQLFSVGETFLFFGWNGESQCFKGFGWTGGFAVFRFKKRAQSTLLAAVVCSPACSVNGLCVDGDLCVLDGGWTGETCQNAPAVCKSWMR
jgi:hypothetical protein